MCKDPWHQQTCVQDEAGNRAGAGAVVIERCASFQQRGFEWAKKKVQVNRQRAVEPVELQP